jgi:Domain of unknown function (DUF3387)
MVNRVKRAVMVKRILNRYGYPPVLQDEAVQTVLAQAAFVCTLGVSHSLNLESGRAWVLPIDHNKRLRV